MSNYQDRQSIENRINKDLEEVEEVEEDPTSLFDGFMAKVLAHHDINIDSPSDWHHHNYFTKRIINRDLINIPLLTSSIISLEAATIIITTSSPKAEVDSDVPYLPIGEYLFDSWNEECSNDRYSLRSLKYIICGPIVNQEINDTIKDVLGKACYLSKEIDEGIKGTFSLIHWNPDLFRMLMNTDIGKQIAGMCNHHTSTLFRQVSKIHVWSHVPGSIADGVLVFELDMI